MLDEPDIVFSDAILATQTRNGAAGAGEKIIKRGWNKTVTDDLKAFLEVQDSFYLATAGKSGQPYIQHRGGPKGFLKPLDDNTLGFADFRGNKQYISTGNLTENPKAFIFLMNYPARTRIKIWGRAEESDDAKLIKTLSDGSYNAVVERAIRFTIEAWDINCRQHIVERYTEEDVQTVVAGLQSRIKELEALVVGQLVE